MIINTIFRIFDLSITVAGKSKTRRTLIKIKSNILQEQENTMNKR